MLNKTFKIALLGSLICSPSFADMTHDHAHTISTAVSSEADETKTASFDILAAHVHHDERTVTFHMTTRGPAGSETPDGVGDLAGAPVWSYVWPTTMDPSAVGFEEKSGILALAATNHPDFDDTPLFDENNDGNRQNDGGVWHSHWVVLTPNEACGPGALAVKDIPAGSNPVMPMTWPGLPIYIDSPGYAPIFDGPEISVQIPMATEAGAFNYDGVTSALKVNDNIHAPLLCVTDVFDIASGDLSLPGVVE